MRLLPVLLLSAATLLQAPAVHADTARILLLGDSITQSDPWHVSYRYALWTRLIDAGIDFDFVGSMVDNFGGNPTWPDYLGESFDRDHEGHWGWRTDEILDGRPGEPGLSTWLQGYTPDIALVHIGTNDILQDQDLPETALEIEELIETLRDANPDVTILLAQLIPCTIATCNDATGVPELNALIAGVASALFLNESPIYLVDQFSGFDAVTDTFDGLHPNTTGEAKMAQRWLDTIAAGVLHCEDGIDNDGDGLVDALDPGCLLGSDRTEHCDGCAELPCDDGLDNDEDGFVDFAIAAGDPGCRTAYWPLEDPQCQDGVENDVDGFIDWDGGASAGLPPASQTAPDPQCVGAPWRNRETAGCGLGFELALLLPLLVRRRAQA